MSWFMMAFNGISNKRSRGDLSQKVGSAKAAPVLGSCGWSLAHFPSENLLGEPPIQT